MHMQTPSKVADIYEKYLNENELLQGLRDDLIKGSLRINPRNYNEGYVTHPKFDSDILIRGDNKNRALFDDIVAVKILPKSQWKVNVQGFVDQGLCDDKIESLSELKDQSIIKMRSLLKVKPKLFKEKFNITSNINCDDNNDFPSNFDNWYVFFQRTGKVVGIINKLNPRVCFGELQHPLKNAKTVKFSPADKKFPRIDIPIELCPPDYSVRPESYKGVKFIVEITEWNNNRNRPLGKISNCLKGHTAFEQESLKILAENGVNEDSPEFENLMEDNVDNTIPYKMSELDYKFRKDLRKDPSICVISIDPKTARDLDDALHVKMLSEDQNGRILYEVGVHIADVTYYIPDDHPIDIEARSRCTTVYLVNRAIAMLPRELCEKRCSLTPGTDKACYSVIYKLAVKENVQFEMNGENSPGDIEFLDTWFGRTLINSSTQLSYEDAQEIIDEPDKDWKNDSRTEVFNNFNYGDIANSVLMLNKLSQILRFHRFANGSLAISQPSISFVLSEDKSTPLGFTSLCLNTSNHLIEEWMLRANMSIAKLLHDKLPELAFLRCHQGPSKQNLSNLNKELAALGWLNLQLDSGKSADMKNLINAFDPRSNEYLAVLNICSKALQMALYICNGIGLDDNRSIISQNADNDEDSEESTNFTHHFALNVPIYTHFTSPIRRYADVIVHRQLTLVLIDEEKVNLERAKAAGDEYTIQEIQQKIDWLSKFTPKKDVTPSQLYFIAERCNKKRKDAKIVQEGSQFLHYAMFVEKCGPFEEEAWVSGLLDKAFDILLTKTGFNKRVYCDQMNLENTKFNKKEGSLTLEWKHSANCKNQTKHARPKTILNFGSSIDVVIYTELKDANSMPAVKFALKHPGCNLCNNRECKDNSVKKYKAIDDFKYNTEITDHGQFYKALEDI